MDVRRFFFFCTFQRAQTCVESLSALFPLPSNPFPITPELRSRKNRKGRSRQRNPRAAVWQVTNATWVYVESMQTSSPRRSSPIRRQREKGGEIEKKKNPTCSLVFFAFSGSYSVFRATPLVPPEKGGRKGRQEKPISGLHHHEWRADCCFVMVFI